MFNSDILEVAIGIVFVFVLISTICSAVREAIEAWLKTRAAYLEHGIRQLLHDRAGTGLAKALFTHPMVFGLFSGEYKPGRSRQPALWGRGRNLPSYIPSRAFALAMLDIAAHGPVPATAAAAKNAPAAAPAAPASHSPASLAQIRANVLKIENPAVRRALLVAIDGAYGDIERARANIETWYDSTMDRVSGWYKRATQQMLFGIAIVLTVGMNINTLTIADYLYRHATLRSVIVSTVGQVSRGDAAESGAYQLAQEQLDAMHLPIGWDNGLRASFTPAEIARRHATGYVLKIPYLNMAVLPWDDVFQPLVGWLITAFAATLGAPFWFDVLNKISALRSTVKPALPTPYVPAQEAPSVRAAAPRAPPATAQQGPPGGVAVPPARAPAAQGGTAPA